MFTLKKPGAIDELPRILEGRVMNKVSVERDRSGASRAKLRLEMDGCVLELMVGPLGECEVETDYILPQIITTDASMFTETGAL